MPENFEKCVADKLAKLGDTRYILRNGQEIFIYCVGNRNEWNIGGLSGVVNYNCKYKDNNQEEIVCRHLAFAWLQNHKRRGIDGRLGTLVFLVIWNR